MVPHRSFDLHDLLLPGAPRQAACGLLVRHQVAPSSGFLSLPSGLEPGKPGDKDSQPGPCAVGARKPRLGVKHLPRARSELAPSAVAPTSGQPGSSSILPPPLPRGLPEVSPSPESSACSAGCSLGSFGDGWSPRLTLHPSERPRRKVPGPEGRGPRPP